MVKAIDRYEIPCHGVGNPTTDNATFATAVANFNASTRAADIVVTGDLHLNGSHTLTKPGRLRFEHDGKLSLHAGASVTWGTDTVGFSSGTAITASSEPFQTSFISPTLAFTDDDYVALLADNEVTGSHTRHTDTIEQRPCSLHRVVKSIAANTYRLYEPSPDALTLNPRAVKLTMIKEAVIENLRYTWADGTTPTTHWLFLNQIANLRLVHPKGIYPVPGGIWFDLCYNVTVEHPSIDAKYDPLASVLDAIYGYNFIVGTCTRLRFIGGQIGMCRHGITTTSGFTKATTNERYGTSLMCSVHGVEFSNPYGNAAFNAIDNHAEGLGWVFDGLTCEVDVNGATETTGLFIRSRRAIVRNSTFRGGREAVGNRASGIWLSGPYAEVHNNTFSNLLFGIQGYDFGGYNSDYERIHHNKFSDLLGPAVLLSRGVYSEVTHNECNNVGYGGTYAGASLRGAIILELDFNAKIYQNTIPRVDNTFAIRTAGVGSDFDCVGNTLTGYDGVTTHVFQNTSTAGPSQNATYAVPSKNFVDADAATNREIGEDNLGTISAPYTVDFDADDFDNKVMTLGVTAVALTVGITRTKTNGFNLTAIQDGTGGRLIDFQNVTFIGDDPQPAPAPGAKSLYKFWRHNGTNFGMRIA